MLILRHPPSCCAVPAALAFGLAIAMVSSAVSAHEARTVDFNHGWRFERGENTEAKHTTYDDSDWTTVDTPHDWAIAGPFETKAHGYAGKLPWWGIAWYRKSLKLDPADAGSKVYLDFDGVMACPQVYVNGELAGEWDYGYTPFRIDLTPHLHFDQPNVIAVRVDTTKHGTRWYPGAGIYRKVSLSICPPVHLARHGTFVTTPKITNDRAEILVENEIDNHLSTDELCGLEITVLSPTGEELGRQRTEVNATANNTATASNRFAIDKPERWDLATPRLHTIVTRLLMGGREVERRETKFGIRTVELTANKGLLLNGRRVPLRGVNLHHDLGPLGAAFNRRAAERQLDILQDMGVNAIRTAHNPPAAEFLDLCDERGLLVWNELFDKWNDTSDRASTAPFEPYFARHAAALVRRDRNHPSVILWSIGNEIIEAPHDPEGLTKERVSQARKAMLAHDPTRPVGLACHIPNAADSGVLDELDFTGWNYQARYDRARKAYPSKPIIYSETASTVSTRGDYRLPLMGTKCEFLDEPVVSAFEFSSPAWGDIPEVEFERLRRDDYLLGEFVWTGFDYLGEPTPFDQAARSSYFGIIDLVGHPKDRFYLYRSLWRPDVPTVHLAPHWNWPGHEGRPVPVIAYTNGDSAELFVNGKSQGIRRKGEAPTPAEDLAVDKPSHNRGAEPSSQVDLVTPGRVRAIVVDFARETKLYGYRIEVMKADGEWQEVASHAATIYPMWGGVKEAVHRVDAEGSKVRVMFGDCLEDVERCAADVRVYAEEYESPYYRPTYDYRLRWNNVVYEPGSLRVVAYKDGQVIGEDEVHTAGPAAKLSLTADRDQLSASGEDLAFVTIDARDDTGVFCPHADNLVRVEVTGAGKLVALGNGDPTSMRTFHENSVALFGGKAIAIVRPTAGDGGEIRITVSGGELGRGESTLHSHRTKN
ncbi:glycoside hydrolase family 2 TIM barrel-domain containing protein [Aeoliella sp. SH292]|uniref:glycoside hydrolase family 2 TIM barrel-domain containing protein n=1 Tax=Aeoliella sp. SH292 TaxID=3454464 RepID=UPI003F98803B